MSKLDDDPAWRALMAMPIIDTRTDEEKADCELAMADIRAGRYYPSPRKVNDGGDP